MVYANEAGDIEPLHSAKTSLSIKAALLYLTEEVCPALPAESITAFPEVIFLKTTADSPLNYTYHPSFLLYLCITNLKSHEP